LAWAQNVVAGCLFWGKENVLLHGHGVPPRCKAGTEPAGNAAHALRRHEESRWKNESG